MPDQFEMTKVEIRSLVAEVALSGAKAEAAWEQLRPLGAAVVPYLADGFTRAKHWQGRAALVYYAIPYARVSEDAFQLGLIALKDKSYMVRYRACMVLAYSLRRDAIPALQGVSTAADARTVEDVHAALDAIEHGDHHRFVDRTHSGQTFWRVKPEDVPPT